MAAAAKSNAASQVPVFSQQDNTANSTNAQGGYIQ
jgi:hypothetical protein